MTLSDRHVGLFGGSFNPPHICHLLLSVTLLETDEVDEVWWLPVHQHAFAKDRELAPWENRLAMCEAVAEPFEGIRVVDVEARLEPPSYTFDTVAALREAHPGVRFSWVMGSDLLDELPRWHRWNELREILDFLVLGRGDERAEVPGEGRFQRVDFTLPDISSTQIRALLRAGKADAVRPLIPAAVADYLRDHPGLYR